MSSKKRKRFLSVSAEIAHVPAAQEHLLDFKVGKRPWVHPASLNSPGNGANLPAASIWESGIIITEGTVSDLK